MMSKSDILKGFQKREHYGPFGIGILHLLGGVCINWDFGFLAIVQVGVTQGIISCISIFLPSALPQCLYRTIKQFGWNGSVDVPLGFFLINGAIFGTYFLAETLRILPTMGPRLIVSAFSVAPTPAA